MVDTIQRHKRGGLYFEDFEVGKTYEHRYTRTVTQMDNMLFSNMTLNPQPLHIDRHFCETETEWGQPLMNSLFTLGLMIGIQVSDMTVGTTIANLGMTDAIKDKLKLSSGSLETGSTRRVLYVLHVAQRPDRPLEEPCMH